MTNAIKTRPGEVVPGSDLHGNLPYRRPHRAPSQAAYKGADKDQDERSSHRYGRQHGQAVNREYDALSPGHGTSDLPIRGWNPWHLCSQ